MYQEVCFNQGTEAGEGGVNAGHSLSPPSHFMLATGLRSSSVPESLETFQPSYASSKGKWVSSFLKTMPSEIGFPMTLTSGAFVNKKRNKQTSHELQNNLDSSCISFCTPSRKRQFKTSPDDTKLSQLQLSVSKFPDAAKIFRMNSPVKFWPIRT